MSSSFISVHNLRFRYPGAINDTLNIPALEISGNGLIALVGPSGAGKSTFIELIAGTLREPYLGSLHVLGTELQDLKKDADRQRHLRRIGFIPQDYGLLPGKTVAETINQDLIDADVPKDEHAKRIAESLQSVDLQELRERLIEHLSGGQRQRIAIARMLARDVELVIADEPTANLDQSLAGNIISLFRQLAENIPVIIVTHDGHVAEQCNRTIVLQTASSASPNNNIITLSLQQETNTSIKKRILMVTLTVLLLCVTAGVVLFASDHSITQAQVPQKKTTSTIIALQTLTPATTATNQLQGFTQQGNQLGLKSTDFSTFIQAFTVAFQSHDITDIENATDTENFISLTWNAGGGYGSWESMKSGLESGQNDLGINEPITTAAMLGYDQCYQYTAQGIGHLGINFDDGNTTQYIVGSRSYYEGYMYTGTASDAVFAFEQTTNGTWLWRAVTFNNVGPTPGLCM